VGEGGRLTVLVGEGGRLTVFGWGGWQINRGAN